MKFTLTQFTVYQQYGRAKRWLGSIGAHTSKAAGRRGI